MKGISTVIATILMLMITIALAGTAYLYISGVFTQQTQGLEIVDAFCVGGKDAVITIRNVGTTDISFVGATTSPFKGDCSPATGNTARCGTINIVKTSGPATSGFKGRDNTLKIEPGTTADIIDEDSATTATTESVKPEGCTTAGTTATCVYRITPPSGRSIVATVSCIG